MKTREKIPVLFILLASFGLMLSGCDLLGLKSDDDLSAEDAKIEVRAAAEDIKVTMTAMMEQPAMVSMIYLSELMGIDSDFKAGSTSAMLGKSSSSYLGMSKIMKVYRALTLGDLLQSDKNDNDYNGVYEYNFVTDEFDLVNSNVSYLEYRYPADETAYDSGQNNCVIRISNLEITEVEDEYGDIEEIPTRFNASQKINNQEVMTTSYTMGLSNDNMPNSASIQTSMPPYSMNLSFSGSNRDFTLGMSFKEGTSTILGADINLRYTADMESVEKMDGRLDITPLRFKGTVNAEEMELCEMELACMNSNLDVEVWQTELDQRIGKLEFKMVWDEDYEEDVPELVLVYEDGSFEYLSELLGEIMEE
jgi:hypothetical protein